MSITIAERMKNVLKMEADSISRVIDLITEENATKLEQLYARLRDRNAQLVFCGVGKSGLIGEKLSSTFASLGLRSIFLHPTEALHGDLGRVTKDDGMVFLSKSGTTSEILKLMPYLPMGQNNLVALVGDTTKDIAQKCDIVFDCSVEKEACINNLAPTTSSTVALAMGDAMAVAYEQFIDLTKESYATFHPGGMLGKSLLMKVKDLMWEAKDCATLSSKQVLKDAILEMTQNPVGACAIVDGASNLEGILVEGDIRRNLAKNEDALSAELASIMTKEPVTIGHEKMAHEALALMEEKQIYVLPIVEDKKFLGFLRMHDLLKEGFSKQS
jgi:arabinose-5-phosphate isomerase